MSGYSVYVWVGDIPASDAEASATSRRLWDEHGATAEQPAPDLVAYLRDFTARRPRVIDPNLMGPFLYMDIPFAAMERAYPDIVELADNHGLVCFDPQAERLMTHPLEAMGF